MPAYYENLTHNSTVNKYYEAITGLVEQYPPNNISVQMILDETSTSRQTFYNYFADKYELINYVYYHDIAPVLTFCFDNHETFRHSLAFIQKMIYKKRNYYKKICSMAGQNSFREFHKKFWFDMHEANLIKYYGDKYDVQMKTALLVYISGLSDMLFHWMENNCENLPESKISELCYQYIFPELEAALYSPRS